MKPVSLDSIQQTRSANRGVPWMSAILLSLSLLLFSGCGIFKVGPDYVTPDYPVPDVWTLSATAGLAEGETTLKNWWKVLDDPLLDQLMDRAVEGNLDLEEAFARILEARAVRGIATGERFPDVNASGELTRQRQSEDFGALSVDKSGFPDSQSGWIRQGGIDGTWEIDFWGRISRSIASADANLQASIEDYRDVLVLLYSEIARNYVDVRTFQERIRVAEYNVKTQRDSLDVTQARFNAEISPELDVQQAKLNLARTESVIPTLQEQLARAVHRLGVLIGAFPGALFSELAGKVAIPNPPPTVLVSVPAEMMRQRPDIRSAERRLASQTEQIGIATAELYPTFSLLGDFGYLGARNDLIDGSRKVYSFGPSFRWNLFDGGRIRNRINVEDARTHQALIQYENTVLEALEDVENAMVSYDREKERRVYLQRSVDAAQQSVNLVNVLYKSGLTDFQNVLDSERSLAEQMDAQATSEGQVVQNLIQIYRAMGGGWEPDPEAVNAEIQDAAMHGEPIF